MSIKGVILLIIKSWGHINIQLYIMYIMWNLAASFNLSLSTQILLIYTCTFKFYKDMGLISEMMYKNIPRVDIIKDINVIFCYYVISSFMYKNLQ